MLSAGRLGLKNGLVAVARPTTTTFKHALPRASFAFSFRQASTKRYTKEHEWISYDAESKVGTIGITDYAQKSLGDVVYVDLPEVDQVVAEGDQMGAVESVKAASDIFAPVSGIIKEVNTELSTEPSLLNKSADQLGWLAKIELSDPQQFETLLTDEAYKAHCEGEEDH